MTSDSSPEQKPPAIRIADMRVDYGEFTAVAGVSLSIPEGEIFGLVGPNGAGKTSMFKVLATLMEPTYGDVFLCDIDIREEPERARRHFGYMPDLAPTATDLKVWEFLDMFAAAHGWRGKRRRERVLQCLEAVDLLDKQQAFCKALSRGMTQRLVLAKNLLHHPRVLLLDEPASGMDPISRAALRDTLRRLAGEGATVLISSHILSELSDLCTQVGVLSRGRLLDSGAPDDVAARMSAAEHRILRISLLRAHPETMDFLKKASSVDEVAEAGSGRELTLHFTGGPEAQGDLLRELISRGAPVRSFSEKASSIEDVILNL